MQKGRPKKGPKGHRAENGGKHPERTRDGREKTEVNEVSDGGKPLTRAEKLYVDFQSIEQKWNTAQARNKPKGHLAALSKKFKEIAEQLIQEDSLFAAEKEIEQAMWKYVFYRTIESFRTMLRSPDVVRKGESGNIIANLFEYLDSVFSFYVSFLVRLGVFTSDKDVLDLQESLDFGNSDVILPRISTSKKEICAHRILIYLGDIERYRVLHNGQNKKVFAVPETYYICSARFAANRGNPFNQMAVLSMYATEHLSAAYYYLRSLCVETPFYTARDNLGTLFENNRAAIAKRMSDAAARRQPTGRGRGARKDKKAELTLYDPRNVEELVEIMTETFLRIVGILYTKTSVEQFDGFLRSFIIYLEEAMRLHRDRTSRTFGISVRESEQMFPIKPCPGSACSFLGASSDRDRDHAFLALVWRLTVIAACGLSDAGIGYMQPGQSHTPAFLSARTEILMHSLTLTFSTLDRVVYHAKGKKSNLLPSAIVGLLWVKESLTRRPDLLKRWLEEDEKVEAEDRAARALRESRLKGDGKARNMRPRTDSGRRPRSARTLFFSFSRNLCVLLNSIHDLVHGGGNGNGHRRDAGANRKKAVPAMAEKLKDFVQDAEALLPELLELRGFLPLGRHGDAVAVKESHECREKFFKLVDAEELKMGPALNTLRSLFILSIGKDIAQSSVSSTLGFVAYDERTGRFESSLVQGELDDHEPMGSDEEGRFEYSFQETESVASEESKRVDLSQRSPALLPREAPKQAVSPVWEPQVVPQVDRPKGSGATRIARREVEEVVEDEQIVFEPKRDSFGIEYVQERKATESSLVYAQPHEQGGSFLGDLFKGDDVRRSSNLPRMETNSRYSRRDEMEDEGTTGLHKYFDPAFHFDVPNQHLQHEHVPTPPVRPNIQPIGLDYFRNDTSMLYQREGDAAPGGGYDWGVGEAGGVGGVGGFGGGAGRWGAPTAAASSAGRGWGTPITSAAMGISGPGDWGMRMDTTGGWGAPRMQPNVPYERRADQT